MTFEPSENDVLFSEREHYKRLSEALKSDLDMALEVLSIYADEETYVEVNSMKQLTLSARLAIKRITRQLNKK